MHVPVKRPARGELDIDTKTRNALLRSLRYQGERGFALMSQRWSAIQHVSVSPTIGNIVKSVLVLTQFEHKMISLKSLRKLRYARHHQARVRGGTRVTSPRDSAR